MVVLCGCEIWSLTLREEHRLRVFENRVLIRIFGPKRNGEIGSEDTDWVIWLRMRLCGNLLCFIEG
jgi:hypothetical protein